eukprot:TRINITY_DN2810_c0_g1_i3.p2 TRINITY_DN2810_c0_g1~~TRINITY_DN2810_c0_g1_i3.p2  ORF type:complete len:142 (+),score=42.16 TRINITY_DN2810_c0_g1_i3:61-486(+)
MALPMPVDESGAEVTDEGTLMALGDHPSFWGEISDEMRAKQPVWRKLEQVTAIGGFSNPRVGRFALPEGAEEAAAFGWRRYPVDTRWLGVGGRAELHVRETSVRMEMAAGASADVMAGQHVAFSVGREPGAAVILRLTRTR